MNERIKQLAVEAGMIVGEPNGFDMTRLMPKEVKFAELIVRECMTINKQELSFNAFERLMNKYQDHFGVE